MMNRILTLALVAAMGLFCVTLVGCEQESSLEDSLEDAGDSMNDAAEDAGDAMGDALDDAGDAVDDAADDVEDAVN